MNRRYSVIATALTALVVTGYQLRQMDAPVTAEGGRQAATAPVVEAPPSLQKGMGGKGGLGSPELWNLRPGGLPLPGGKLPPLTDLFKPFYTLGKNGRFQSIQRSDRPNEQWQFQGVLVRDGACRALFYNSGLKRLKNLGRGDLVDEGLRIRSVGPDSVTVEVVGEKKPQTFDLRLFNANKENYAAKRKTL